MPKTLLGPLYVFVLIVSVLSVASPSFSADRITSDVRVTTKDQLSATEKRALSQAAVRILKHVHQARVDLRYSNASAAQKHVEKALTLVRIVENAVPSTQVTATIQSGDFTYRDEDSVKQYLVPIYSELDETTSLLLPIKRAKKEAAASSSEPVMDDLDLQYTSVSLDIREAKYYLERSEKELKTNNATDADQSLAAVQESVILEYEEADLPLVKARWNLLEAARMAANNRLNEAGQYLQKASDALESYATKAGQEMSKTSKSLSEEIKTLRQKLEEKGSAAAETINSLWDKLTNRF